MFRRSRSSLAFVCLVSALGCAQKKSAPQGSPSAPAVPSASASVTATSKAFYATRFSKKASVPAMTALGRRLFFDPELSASGKMACATCHDPHFAYGPANARSTQLGGPDLKSEGLRAVPSLRYVQTVPPFSVQHFDEAVDESVDQGPTGGRTWDGRAASAHDQARAPLTSPFEMANESVDAVAQKVARGEYAGGFRDAFGPDVFEEPARASAAVLLALEVFQEDPKEFYPYSSRYDAWLRQKGTLTASEERGRKLFDDPRKGNCAHCHPSGIRQGAFPQFTDFGFIAVGVPRNGAVAANADPAFYDLGLCGPLRTDLTEQKKYCGMFRAPTLRNVALRRVFFHNGVFHQLRDVLEFYVQRDTNPKKWYPHGVDTGSGPFDDLPQEYRENVNREPPLDRKPGDHPALNAAEIADVIAFLRTLTDGDLAERSPSP
jgi:cytochrome c peroxidase